MPDDDPSPLTIDLRGPTRHALLTVEPPEDLDPKSVEFDVIPTGGAEDQLVRVSTRVVFTTAVNRADGWPTWHVKIYRCGSVGDADALRQHLHRQAAALQQVNTFLPAQRRQAFEPPWAVVPVQVVRGDGQPEQLAGAVSTRLGVASDEIVARLHRRLPAWLGAPARPDQVLLAVSPQVDALPWEEVNAEPATEHLDTFATLAVGLDHLHEQNWVHCDIKPDNVCRCSYDGVTGYVLIDTDAATRADPPPPVVRSTNLYQYRGLRDWHRGARPGPLRPGDLYAQDRFGFLTVLLSALAGRDWVNLVLLAENPSDPGGERIADSAESVRRALSAIWPDPRWTPLIEALAEPFGDGLAGRVALERAEPWAEAWLAGLVEAESRCGRAPAPERSRAGQPLAAVRAVERVRSTARNYPAAKHKLVRRAYDAIGEVAQDVARREARVAMWVWGGGLVGGSVLVALNAFVMGR